MKIGRVTGLLSLFVLVACQTNSPNTASVTARAAETTAGKSIPPVVRDKLQRMTNSDPQERAWAAYQLGKIGPAATAAIPALVELLRDDSAVLLSRYVGGGYQSSSASSPGEEAAQALAKIGNEAVPALTAALQQPSPVTRRFAVRALGQIGELRTIPAMLPLFDDEDRQVRAAVAIALGNYRHPQAAQLILDALPAATVRARSGMVYALGQINDVIAVPVLIERVAHEEVDVRVAIMHALGRLRDGRAIETLLQGLLDSDDIVRANAANALSNYYQPEVIGALIKVLTDTSSRVREASHESLQNMSGQQLPPDPAIWQQWWQQQQAASKPTP